MIFWGVVLLVGILCGVLGVCLLKKSIYPILEPFKHLLIALCFGISINAIIVSAYVLGRII